MKKFVDACKINAGFLKDEFNKDIKDVSYTKYCEHT